VWVADRYDVDGERKHRDVAMFGYWGGGVNVVDRRYTYFCYPKDMKSQELYQYTLMPAHMTKLFTVEELKSASLVGPFNFTKGVPLLRIAHKSKADTKTHSYHSRRRWRTPTRCSTTSRQIRDRRRRSTIRPSRRGCATRCLR